MIKIELNVYGKKMIRHDFKCFDNEASVHTAKEILDGRIYKAFENIGAVDTIVDIGANIGATAVFFKNMYSEAAIYCFEPNPASFELLSFNTSNLKDVVVSNCGLHEIESTVKLYKGRMDGISDSIIPCSTVTDNFVLVPLKNAAEEMHKLHINAIDILKIDTEGCEISILRSLVKWLHACKVIYLEYHSELDRLLIDVILRKTHVLYSSNAANPHRGELTYIHNELERRCCHDLIEQ